MTLCFTDKYRKWLVAVLCLSLWVRGQAWLGALPGKTTRESNNRLLSAQAVEDVPQKGETTFLNRLGFRRASEDSRALKEAEPTVSVPSYKNNVTTLAGLEEHFADKEGRFRKPNGSTDSTALIRALNVEGDTQIIGSPDCLDYTHPVAQLLHERRRQAMSTGAENNDGCKIALSVEGGGMRGCISAGMIAAIHHLNLTSAFDVVYGSSAGTIIGAYLITGQLPWFGPEVYYDRLTTAGNKFIDTRRLLRALGFGLLDPRLLKDVLTRRELGKPVLNLSFLLKTTVEETKPLDWDKFLEMQSKLPLKIMSSGLKSQKAVVLEYNNGFNSLSELTDAMHASCLLPGIAGPVANLDRKALKSKSSPKIKFGSKHAGEEVEPLADSLLFEPMPYRSAVAEGATHVVVIRSRPDGTDVTGKGGVFESMIFRRFFKRKNKLPGMYRYVKQQLHKKLYAEDVIRLNDAAHNTRDYKDLSEPHLMTIAAPPGSPEVGRLETRRKEIFEGMRRGFARAYDCLVEDPKERGRGVIVAKEFFPDEILDYDPDEIDSLGESAFSMYLRSNGVTPKIWTENHFSEDQVVRPR